MNVTISQRVMAEAYIEWEAGTSEKDLKIPGGGRLAKIFADSGWGGFTYKANGSLSDWCGFFVGAMLYRAGMHPAHRNAFFHAMNIEDFAEYGERRLRNPRRLKKEVLVDGVWMKVKEWHEREGKMRKWLTEADIRSTNGACLNPADVLLIDYQGISDKCNDEPEDGADHVTLVAEPLTLEVLNGNARGLSVDGSLVSDAVSRTIHDLKSKTNLLRFYGALRLSDLDFDRSVTYR